MFYQRSDLHEKEDFSEDIKKLTKKYVVSIINQIYDEFGCNEMEMTRDWGEPAERRVMDGSGILWKTFHHLDDYDVEKNTITMELVMDEAHNAAKPHSGGCAQYDSVNGPTYNRKKKGYK